MSLLPEHGHHLLDEEGVSLRDFRDLAPIGIGKRGVAREVVDEGVRLLLGQRPERERRRIQLSSSPIGPLLEELGARDAEKEDGGIARPVGEVVDQVEEGGLAPVNVLEYDDERASARERLEEPPHGPEGLFRGSCRVVAAERGGDPLADAVGRFVVCNELSDRRAGIAPVAGQLANDFCERPKGDPVAVRETAPGDHGGGFGHCRDKLRHERTPSVLPLSASEPTGSTRTASRTRRRVVSLRTISPASAVCSRRAATLTASPVTSIWPASGSPATTSPVLMPVRISIFTARSAS